MNTRALIILVPNAIHHSFTLVNINGIGTFNVYRVHTHGIILITKMLTN